MLTDASLRGQQDAQFGGLLATGDNTAKVWGPLIGPVVAIISFVCSIGNVPLAVVLWKGGISFGGVFLILGAALVIRFVRTGGLAMLRMMGGSPDGHEHDRRARTRPTRI